MFKLEKQSHYASPRQHTVETGPMAHCISNATKSCSVEPATALSKSGCGYQNSLILTLVMGCPEGGEKPINPALTNAPCSRWILFGVFVKMVTRKMGFAGHCGQRASIDDVWAGVSRL